jgi:Flp pilus assembly protein TadG
VPRDDPERGSAALEFILVGVVLLVPIVYLIVTLGIVQQHSLGAVSAARHVARAISTASDSAEADERARRVMAAVADEYDMDAATVDVSVTCTPAEGHCPQAGSTIVVTVRTTVTLPLVPALLGLDRIAAVPIEATGLQRVSRLWGQE